MFVCLLLAVICGFIGSLAHGILVVESIPRRPEMMDRVILRCHASPTRVYFRLNCQFEWDWTPLQPPVVANWDDDDDDDPQLTLPSHSVVPWWKVSNQDVSDTGSVIVIDELKPEHQGRYVCRLSCGGQKRESVTLMLEIGEDSGQLVNAQNSKIAYLATGVIFGIIILATVLRFLCVNIRECRWLLKDNISHNIRNVNTLRNQLASRQPFGFSSTETVCLKPSSDRRPSILDRNVWLPPYEAALRYPRLDRPTITTPENAVGRPPTYEEALVGLIEEPRNDSCAIQTV